MPKGLDHLGLAVIGGKIITVGGFVGSAHRGAVSDVYEYDPATDTWRTLAPLKTPRGSVGVTVLDGKIHAVGGRGVDNTFTVGTHEVLRPGHRDSWTSGPVAEARDHMALVAPRQAPRHRRARHRAASRVDTHDVYDPKTNSWSAGPPLPTARSGLASTIYQGLIVVLGGELPPDTFPNNEAYDPKTNAWRTLAPMPHGRHGTGAAVIGNSLYVAAGSLEARFGRGDRPVDRVHDALNRRHSTSLKGPYFAAFRGR